MAADQPSDLSHSKPCDCSSEDTKKSKFSLLSRLRSNDIRERSLGRSAVISAGELDQPFPDRWLKLYVASWNMEGKEFPHNLEDLLLPSDDDFAKDIYVIGVQEGSPNRREWEIRLQEILGPHYVLYHSSRHGVLYLTIFVRRELIWFCSKIEHVHVTTRIFHHVKTKGALGVASSVFGTSFLFINSHLRFGALNKRIQDYKTITEDLCLPQKLPEVNNSGAYDVTSRFDRVFWFGDLNFQLKEDRKTVESPLQNIDVRHMSSLLKHDQLNEAKSHGRVQFKSQYEGEVRVLRYDSCPQLKTSDH